MEEEMKAYVIEENGWTRVTEAGIYIPRTARISTQSRRFSRLVISETLSTSKHIPIPLGS